MSWNAPPKPTTRLAPTPSGNLHAGNAFSFVLAWLAARTRSGRVLLRIEDTDSTRSRPGWVEDVFRDLEWLGLDWDEGPSGPDDLESAFRQSSAGRQARYAGVLEDWIQAGLAYPCRCTRRELSVDAPQVERLRDPDLPANPYPGTCRPRMGMRPSGPEAWRLALPATPSRIGDLARGTSRLPDLSALGDPVLRRGDGCFAYHLAVCVDDADQGVDLVVRGRDLAPWAHLHAHLHALLGSSPPAWAHHAIAGGSGGERLAKRIGSASLSAMRRAGAGPERLLGLFAPLLHPESGLDGTPLSLAELATLPPPDPAMSDFDLILPESP